MSIECNNHGNSDGYVVCVHVLAGQSCEHFAEAKQTGNKTEDLGEVLCKACSATFDEGSEPPIEDMRLVCGGCVKARLRLPAMDSEWGD